MLKAGQQRGLALRHLLPCDCATEFLHWETQPNSSGIKPVTKLSRGVDGTIPCSVIGRAIVSFCFKLRHLSSYRSWISGLWCLKFQLCWSYLLERLLHRNDMKLKTQSNIPTAGHRIRLRRERALDLNLWGTIGSLPQIGRSTSFTPFWFTLLTCKVKPRTAPPPSSQDCRGASGTGPRFHRVLSPNPPHSAPPALSISLSAIYISIPRAALKAQRLP